MKPKKYFRKTDFLGWIVFVFGMYTFVIKKSREREILLCGGEERMHDDSCLRLR